MHTIKVNRIPWHTAGGGQVLPLGRNVVHDSRNLAYAYRPRGAVGTLRTVLHDRHIPILDQGSVGSCTGNGEVGVLGCDPNYAALPDLLTGGVSYALNESLALKVYSGAEVIDGDGPYPPNDNGSSGPSAAKAAMKLGLISGYTHCLSLTDVLDALQTQAVSIGINWYSSFDSPPSSGLLTISADADVRGGHEPMLRGVDVDKQEVFGDNSWGEGWGVKGSFTMGWATLDRLLHEDGDGTVSVPISQPAPVPVPPQPVPGGGMDDDLWSATREWSAARHVGGNKRAAAAVRFWAQAKGFATPR
jgi:hypothetical protein